MTGNLSGKRFTQISAGGTSTCAVANDNAAYCWGYNSPSGRLGNNSTSQSTTPAAVDMTGALANKSITSVSSTYAGDTYPFNILAPGESHACALTTDKRIYCWGSGNSGQMGNGTNTANNLTPTATVPPHAAVNVTFDTSNADDIVVVSNTQITLTTPPHITGVVDVKVEVGSQDAVAPLGYTYGNPATPPTAPTLTTTRPLDGGVRLTFGAPGSDGGSPITHYQVQYRANPSDPWTLHSTTYTSSPADISGLSGADTYDFQVRAVNAIGDGAWSNTMSQRPIYLTVNTSSPSVALAASSSGTSVTSSQSQTVTTSTNATNGYTLHLSSTNSDRDLTHQTISAQKLTPSPLAQSAPGALSLNTWGYRVDGAGSFGNLSTAQELDKATPSSYTWAGVPLPANSALIRDRDSPIQNQQTQVWYAMHVAADKLAGTYSNNNAVVYTAVTRE